MRLSDFGVQGPWYTVGWKMAVTIEKAYGRKKVIEGLCDPRVLLSTYNRAARKFNRSSREPLALWSAALIEGLSRTAYKTHVAEAAKRIFIWFLRMLIAAPLMRGVRRPHIGKEEI